MSGERFDSVSDAIEVTKAQAENMRLRFRDRLGIVPGDAVEFELMPDGRVLLVNAGRTRPVRRFETLRGRAGPGLSTDEIMAITRGEEWA
jgi:antitoxin PrlF